MKLKIGILGLLLVTALNIGAMSVDDRDTEVSTAIPPLNPDSVLNRLVEVLPEKDKKDLIVDDKVNGFEIDPRDHFAIRTFDGGDKCIILSISALGYDNDTEKSKEFSGKFLGLSIFAALLLGGAVGGYGAYFYYTKKK